MSEFHINGDGFGCYAHIEVDFVGEIHVFKVVGFFESNFYCDVPIRHNTEPYMHDKVVPVANVIHCGVDESKVIRVAIEDCDKIENRDVKKSKSDWFYEIAERLRDYSEGYIWSTGDEILCKTESAANTLADMFETLYNEQGKEVKVKRNGEEDRHTGWWYVNVL